MGKGLTKLAEISLFIGGFLVLWYVTGETIFRRKKKIVKENILLILRHLCLEIYKVLNETSKTTKSVYDMIKNEPNTSIELNKLEEVLLNNGYKQRIEDVEKEVLKKFDVTVDDFYQELKNYEKDEDVQKVLNSIKKMYHESLLGIQPKLPSIDENISQDVILNLTSLIYKKKRKIYKEKIDSMIKKNEDFNLNTTFSNSEFFNKLQKSTEHVEEQVIKENQDLVPNLFTFKYLVNYYSNDINFMQRKKYLESKHGEKMIKILKVKKIKKKKKITKDNLSNNSVKSLASQNSFTDHTSSEKNFFVSPLDKQEDVVYRAGSDISAGNNEDATPPYVEMIPSYHHVEELNMEQDQEQDKFEPTAPLEEHMIDFVQSAQNIEEVHEDKVGAVDEEEKEVKAALLGVVDPSDGEMSPGDSPLSAQTDGGHANEGDGWIHGENYHDEGENLHVYQTKIEDNAEDANVGMDNEENANVGMDNEENANIEKENEENVNVGMDNEENANVGMDNEENANVGIDNEENANIEKENEENANVGMDNEENANVGIDNEENANIEKENEENANVGMDNEENANVGIDNEENANVGIDNEEDGMGYPDDRDQTEEPSQTNHIDQDVTTFLNVQAEGEDEWASAMSQGVDPSVQLEEKEESHMEKTEQDNLALQESANEEGGAINDELPQEENEPMNGEADGGKAEDEPLPQQEDEGVAIEMVEPAKEDIPTEEPIKEELPIDEPAKEDIPTEEPIKEELPIDEPAKEDIPTEEPTKEELPIDEPAKEDIPTEEPTKEELPIEEPAKEDIPTEEPTKEELPIDEPAKEDIPTEEPTKEELPIEEPAKEDIPTEEPIKEELPIEVPSQEGVPTEEPIKEELPIEVPSQEGVPTEEPTKEEQTESKRFGLGKPWKRKKNKNKDSKEK
ncbi:Uncharacterized protein PKNOH_S140276200 [Plasmodium knowlesi]|uniref:Uncharacterized protein n=1 Tax=Plasmodium knowlesi TaxID=5850 RepID=A0A1Y3DL58_PLAKN|nr:Uncharacterized protein PKNOH_S140276200 [Plasmodium knowlesi]